MEQLRYDGKVVVITGAGRGIGREYALLFGKRGASVVVNDLGVNIKGEGKNNSAADQVVEEIRRAGGIAVSNYESVEDGDKIIDTAVKNFGRVDIVINNAGIIRDKTFGHMSDQEWDIIHRVHVRGVYKVTRAAWPFMKKQSYGRIIMTTSSAGIYGNFGQANYSAAKMAQVGFSNTLALEGANYNIHCNTIAPLAVSRLTTELYKGVTDQLKPEYIAPVVLYLCHESCEENGSLFEVGGGWVSKIRWQRSLGVAINTKPSTITPEAVRDAWDEITNWQDSTNPSNIAEAVSLAFQQINAAPESSTVAEPIKEDNVGGINVSKAISHKMPATEFEYTAKNVIVYALGIGTQVNDSNLQFLYEGNEDFCTFPAFATIISQPAAHQLVDGHPGIDIDPTKVVHGEHYVELYKPLPTSGKMKNYAKIVDILDKGKGAVIVTEVTSRDEQGEKVCLNQFLTYIQGHGGFGGKRQSNAIKQGVEPPERPPDAVIKEVIPENQAALYRMSGDLNPLHIDPQFAALGGFSKPILHGLCTMGYANKHILKQYAGNDVAKFRAIKVRFARPIIPGQTLITETWKCNNRIIFQCKAENNNKPVIKGGYVDLVLSDGNPKISSGNLSASNELRSSAIFQHLKKELQSNPSLARRFNCMYLWNISNEKGDTVISWVLDLKGDQPSVYSGKLQSGEADCILTTSDDTLIALAKGQLDAQRAFFTGKLKVKGNMAAAQKLQNLFQNPSKL